MSGVLVQAAAILLREGLEALLVIAALAAYLRKAGAGERLTALYSGAAAAVLASLIAAWIFQKLNDGQHNDLVEAVVIFAAAALMLYVSGWLLVRQDPQAWQAYLRRQAEGALAKGTGWAIALLAFVAVFREGAETVLFIHALATSSGGWSIGLFAGLAMGAAGLAVLYVLINYLAMHLPLRAVFLVTSTFLFAMAIKLIGDAIQELQEQLLVPSHPVGAMAWLLEIGFNPTREALMAQAVTVLAAVITFLIWRRNAQSARREARPS